MAHRKGRYTPGNLGVEEVYYGGEVYDLNERALKKSNKGGRAEDQRGKAKPRDAMGRFIKVTITGA